jgi:hypothetical protein
MMKNKDYAEMYKSRTEEIKKVMRKNDQNTIDYHLYDEAIVRATEDETSDILMFKWSYTMLVGLFAIIVPAVLIRHFIITGSNGGIIISVGFLIFLTIVGIRGILLASAGCSLWRFLMIGNPYANGKMPKTTNPILRKWLSEYRVKTETEFVKMKKDEENSLDAIEYKSATWDSIGHIDVITPLKKIIGLTVVVASILVVLQLILPSGDVKDVIQVAIMIGSLFAGMFYALDRYPLRSEIRRLIRIDNPYRTDE